MKSETKKKASNAWENITSPHFTMHELHGYHDSLHFVNSIAKVFCIVL